MIYLTPYGHSPSDDSKGNIKDVIVLSYDKHILPWLENTKSDDKYLQNAVELYAEQVRNTINRNKYMNEIFGTCFADEESAQTTINIIKAISGKNLLTIPQIQAMIKTRIAEYLEFDIDDWESDNGNEEYVYIKIKEGDITIGNITLYSDYITIEKISNGKPVAFENFDTNNMNDERIQALICNDELLNRYMSKWISEMKNN